MHFSQVIVGGGFLNSLSFWISNIVILKRNSCWSLKKKCAGDGKVEEFQPAIERVLSFWAEVRANLSFYRKTKRNKNSYNLCSYECLIWIHKTATCNFPCDDNFDFFAQCRVMFVVSGINLVLLVQFADVIHYFLCDDLTNHENSLKSIWMYLFPSKM